VTSGVEEWLAHRLGRLAGHLADRRVSVDDLLPTEVPQEHPSALGAGHAVGERLVLIELLQQLKPARGVIALEQRGDGLVDLRDRLTVAGVEKRVGVGEEVVSLPRHGREAGEPAHVFGGDALQVSGLTAALAPMMPKRLVLTRDGPRAETVRGEQERIVVAEQHLDAPADPGSLILQPHDQLDGADAVRSVID
jgi:hypothetical protein